MRQSAKWALVGVGLLALSAIAVGVILVIVLGTARVPGNAVLVVKATGELADADTRSAIEQLLGGDVDTLAEITSSIRRAAADGRVKAIHLKVGDLQAGWAKTQELRSALEAFRDAHKPIYAHLEVGGMREYYLASVADHLSLLPGGMLMPTGLLADSPFFKGTLDKLKIHADMEHIGEYKSASEQWTRDSMSDSQRRATESILDSLYGQIVASISKSRGMTEDQVRHAIDEGLVTPERARTLKLVDDLLYDDQIEDELTKQFHNYAEVRIRSYKKQGGWGGLKRIAVVNASGVIVSGKSGSSAFGGEFIGSDSLGQVLKTVREDDSIRAVVLRVDSPGGSGIASDAIWRQAVLLKNDKPLIVSMADVAASGGYYISMGADAIVAEPATITGSIGVISGKFNMRGFYEDWLGLHRDQIKRGANADLFSDYDGFTDDQRRALRAQMQDFYRDFVHKAAQGRGKSDDQIDRIGQGRIWTGAQAKENGLVDALGGLNEAVELAKKKAGIPIAERVALQVYPRKKSFFESLGSMDDDDVMASRISLPAPLRKVIGDFEVRERIAREGIVLWAGGF